MSGTFPASPVASSIKLGSIQPALVSTAQSLKRQTRTRGGQRWKVSLTWQNRTRAQIAPVWAFVMAQRGQWDSFQIVLPGHDTPQGSWAGGAPLVDGASQAGRTINLKGFTPSQAGVIKAGDVLKFSDSKVYIATADANSTGAGKVAALAIEPALMVAPADGEAVVYTSVPFTMALASDLNDYGIKPPLFYDFALDLMEAW
jgi:hypothetical protein